MCYTARLDSEDSIARIAEEDIPVVKQLYTTGYVFLAPYYTEYNYNSKNHYSELRVRLWENLGVIDINNGLHSLSKVGHNFGNCWATAIIPKGSIYYTNGRENVSTNLVMVEAYKSDKYRDAKRSAKFIYSYHLEGNKSIFNRIKNYFLRIHVW